MGEYEKQEEEIKKRIDKAIEMFGEKVTPSLNLKELAKVLNPENQHEMINLYDFYNWNPEIPCELIFNQLKLGRFIKLYDDKNDDNGLIICQKPYTDFYINPVIIDGDEYIYIERLLVISKDVEDFLQEYCNELLYGCDVEDDEFSAF